MENLIKDNKGIIVLYVVIALLAFACSCRLNNLNIANNIEEKKAEITNYA